MEEAIRIIIIDDHAVFLAALRMLIEGQPGMKVVGEARNRAEAIEITRSLQPDIIVLDLVMGDENGLDYIKELLAESRGGRVIVLTGALDSKLHQLAIQQGAMGLVLKTKGPETLLKAIEKVHQGEVWVDRVTMGIVLSEMSRLGKEDEPTRNDSTVDLITKREREIIKLVAKGFKNKQIADQLHLSDITVRHHLTSIYSKLGVADRFELIVFAYNNSLCDPPGK